VDTPPVSAPTPTAAPVPQADTPLKPQRKAGARKPTMRPVASPESASVSRANAANHTPGAVVMTTGPFSSSASITPTASRSSSHHSGSGNDRTSAVTATRMSSSASGRSTGSHNRGPDNMDLVRDHRHSAQRSPPSESALQVDSQIDYEQSRLRAESVLNQLDKAIEGTCAVSHLRWSAVS